MQLALCQRSVGRDQHKIPYLVSLGNPIRGIPSQMHELNQQF